MYSARMKITFDPVKNERNIRERGLPFHLVEGFDWDSALVEEDARKPYQETRYVTIGFIGGRLFVVILLRQMKAFASSVFARRTSVR
ncbi:MAG: hypothetical protein FD134_2091 [Gallionellaceae bacterium]|nr:MAG: hypothetical protein FD134_2091 [Gallionellaceae bacterium]